MKLVVVLGLLGVFGGLGAREAAADHVFLREADAAHAMFPRSTGATRQALELTDAEREALGKLIGWRIEGKTYPYFVVTADQAVLGTIFLLDMIGQSQPISFAVALGADGTVHDVRVMIYRETHGEEIEDRRFRKQFVGRTLKDPIALGKDVDAISGATISSRSETLAVKKGLGLFEIMKQRRPGASKP